MFDDDRHARDTIVLDFGGAPVQSFTSLVEVDDVPEYKAEAFVQKPLQLSQAQKVEDDGTALFRALGLL